MRVIISATLATALMLSACNPSKGQLANEAAQNVDEDSAKISQDFIRWQQQYFAIVTTLSELFNLENTSFISRLNFEDTEKMETMFSEYDVKRQETLGRAKLLAESLRSPESWDDQKSQLDRPQKTHLKMIEQQYASLSDLIDQMTEVSDFKANGVIDDFEAFNARLYAQQYDAVRRVIRAENHQIDAVLLTIPNTHPNHQLQKIFYASNVAGIHHMDLSELIMLGMVTPEQSLDIGKAIDTAIADIPDLIKTGRLNVIRQRNILKAALREPDVTDDEKSAFDQAIISIETFNDSFDAEQNLYALDQQNAALYRSEIAGEAYDAAAAKINMAYQVHVESRASLIRDRSMISGQ